MGPRRAAPTLASRWPAAAAAALAAAVVCLYARVSGYGFVNVDDALYVFRNPHVLGGLSLGSLAWAFTTFAAGNWHPLTWVSHMAVVSLAGPLAGPQHVASLSLHALNTLLLFAILRRVGGGVGRSAFAAALFAIHPLHVESVAWVAERKDVLSATFALLTIAAYVRYARAPGAWRYVTVVGSFALGLMCKPMLVTLPFGLMLLDVWPLGRRDADGRARAGVRHLWLEKLPLLALAAASCVVTYAAQARGATTASLAHLPLGVRAANAAVSCLVYLWRTVWPARLAVFYPHPASVGIEIPTWQVAGALLVLAALTALAILERHRRPYLAVGWLWFLGTLVPVLGLVQVGAQAMADRYMYLPSIGLFVGLAWGLADLTAASRQARAVRTPAALLALALLFALAWRQLGYWHDDLTLFGHAAAVTERNWFAWDNLGVAYGDAGEPARAIDLYRRSLAIKPDDASAWYNMGVAHERLGQPRLAEAEYLEAVKWRPSYALPWYNLGVLYGSSGRLERAIECYRSAVGADPDYANAWLNLGAAYAERREFEPAGNCFREAVRVEPPNAQALFDLGMLALVQGRRDEALDVARRLEAIDPARARALAAALDSPRFRAGAPR